MILDEFQALVGLGEMIFPLFKEAMESQKRSIYLLSGSSLRLLHEVFGQEEKSPLYQMVGRLFLGEIDRRAVPSRSSVWGWSATSSSRASGVSKRSTSTARFFSSSMSSPATFRSDGRRGSAISSARS